MTSAHLVLGIVTAASIAVVVLWALVAKIGQRSPGPAFEIAAQLVGVLLILQVVFGVVVLGTGHHRTGLHYVYGVAALAVIGAGIALARALQRDRWVVYAWAAFIAGLLVLRALMTGLQKG
jgi:hypothetical protein